MELHFPRIKGVWVAKITGLDSKYVFSRQFLKGTPDLINDLWIFDLKDGIYDVCEPGTFGAKRRYYLRVIEPACHELTFREVKSQLELERTFDLRGLNFSPRT